MPSVTLKRKEHNDELYKHFLNKQLAKFFKCWSSKFHKNILKEVYINGSNKDVDVANAFADQFCSVYYSSDDAADAKKELEALLSGETLVKSAYVNL